jgi:hypothetical protein
VGTVVNRGSDAVSSDEDDDDDDNEDDDEDDGDGDDDDDDSGDDAAEYSDDDEDSITTNVLKIFALVEPNGLSKSEIVDTDVVSRGQANNLS